MKIPLLLAALAAPLVFAQETAPETWEVARIPGMPYTVELPRGGTTRTRDVSNPKLPGGAKTWGWDLTLQEPPAGAGWDDMIRISYTEGWDHLSLADSRKTWGKPTLKTVGGRRTIEVGYQDVPASDGGPADEIHYIVELGPKKFVELLLQCRHSSFKRYAPYYVRMRDSLKPARRGA